MPGYKAPESKELREFTGNLHKHYSGTDADRKKSIRIIENITQSMQKKPDLTPLGLDADKIILGCCVSELEKIQQSYTGTAMLAVSKVGEWTKFFKTGSTLYDSLKAGLKMSDNNDPEDKQRLIYVNQYYQFAKAKQIKLEEKDSKKTKLLVDEIQPIINTLLKRLDSEVDAAIKRPPTHKALLDAFAKIPTAYTELSKNDYSFKSWIGHKELHEKYAKLIKIMNDPAIAKFKLPQGDSCIKWPTSYTIPYATLLHVRNRIAKEYTLRSAKNNSRLYDLCEEGLNLQPGTVIPNDIQDVYLSDLRSAVSRLRHDPEAIKYFEKQGFKEPRKFLISMERELDEELSELSAVDEQQSPTSLRISNIIAWTAQFGMAVISARFAAQLLPSLTKNVISKGAAVIGLIYYGDAGETFFRSIGGVVEEKILSSVSTILNAALDPVGTAIGYIASGAIAIAVSATQAGIQLITFNPKLLAPAEEKLADAEWLRTLRDVLPEDKKKFLLKTHDFTMDAKSENPVINQLSNLSAQIKMACN